MTKSEIDFLNKRIEIAIKAIEINLKVKYRRIDRDDDWKFYYLFEYENCGFEYIKLTQKQMFYLSDKLNKKSICPCCNKQIDFEIAWICDECKNKNN